MEGVKFRVTKQLKRRRGTSLEGHSTILKRGENYDMRDNIAIRWLSLIIGIIVEKYMLKITIVIHKVEKGEYWAEVADYDNLGHPIICENLRF
jgi:hypothetical protein